MYVCIILDKLLVPSDSLRHKQPVPSHQADLDKPLTFDESATLEQEKALRGCRLSRKS